MEELEKVTTHAVDLCLPFVNDNIGLINEGKVTHLLGDFRGGMNEWKTLIQFPRISLFDEEPSYKDKTKLHFIFLMNDGLIEGIIYLLPNQGKLNYAIRVARPISVDDDIFHDRVKLFERVKSN